MFDTGRALDGTISNMAAVVCKVVRQWGMSGEIRFAQMRGVVMPLASNEFDNEYKTFYERKTVNE